MMPSFIIHFFILILILLGASFTSIDFQLQDLFYSIGNHPWMINAQEPIKKWIFYIGLKWLIILFGITCFFTLVFRRKLKTSLRFDILQIILSLILVPLTIWFLKRTTHMHCPNQLLRYGGSNVFVSMWDQLGQFEGSGMCFPAGHASGGFSLICLGYLRNFPRRWGLTIGLGVGWVMGIYQMLKGVHFLSHTLVTQELAFLLNIIIYFLISRRFRTSQ